MTLFELLQAGDSSIALLGGVLAVGFWGRGIRSKTIEAQYRFAPEFWTNEGEVPSQETQFIFLNLQLERGEITGLLRTADPKVEYGVNFHPGWPVGRLVVRQQYGHGLPFVGEYRARLRGNNNRLELRAREPFSAAGFPKRTTLWPVPQGAL